ncbi:MAG TPA: S9 family peptidase, partial [Aequorivita sp.]|nr:S9 family peptidase [Aequorivita sp.]
MKKLIATIAFFLLATPFIAQEKLTYQKPPKEILELVDAPLAPSVWIDSNGENVVLFYRDAYKSIAELSEPEMRLGGLRINPNTNIGSRTRFFNNLKVKKATEKDARQVLGIPENPRLSSFTISPNQKMVAFLNTTDSGVQLWLADIESASARQLSTLKVNANMGNPLNWFKDGSALLVNVIPIDRKDLINTDEAVPDGPTITVSDGEKAQNRTYQDLLSSPNDEYNFEQLARSEIKKISVDGKVEDFLPTAMYDELDFSPDGNYVMVSTIKRPFSYIVPYSRFPFETNIYSNEGKLIKKVNDVPLNEVEPKGFMATRMG